MTRASTTAAIAASAAALLCAMAAQATDVARLPLKASVLAKPNVIVGFDDSGSMDSEFMLDTADGVFWWNFTTGKGWDAAGALHKHIGLVPAEYWSATWRRYFYLFPNGCCTTGLNLKDHQPFGDWAAPPTTDFAWARSADYNPQYYDHRVTYKPWRDANGYAAFADATPSAARGHPLLGGAGNVVDLTQDVAASTANGRHFHLAPGMSVPVLPAATPANQYRVCNSNNGACGAWTATPAADTAVGATSVTHVAMKYWPATYWVKAGAGFDCTIPAVKKVGTDDCALAPDGTKLRRIEIRSTNTSYPSGRSYAAELQNFANWFQYHRKRKLSANAAMGEVLEELTGMRMGVVRFNGLPAAGTRVTMYDLDATAGASNGKAVLQFLYPIDVNAATPTRETLKRIGDEFADANGPIVYACQRNAAMIVTDGYANASNVSAPGYDASKYGSGAPYATTHAPSLADIALSYYTNRLKTALPAGMLKPTANDPNPDLHMNTYALTLGAKGYQFKGEGTPLPAAMNAWTVPNVDFDPSAVDDLWHATINGRGQMYLATSAAETAAKLQKAFTAMRSETGAQGGVAVSTVNLGRSDNRAYYGTYNPDGWVGDLATYSIDKVTGAVAANPTWSASALLTARDWTTRVIATVSGGGGVGFTAAAVGATVNPGGVYGTTSEVMDYLRGDRTHEGTKFRSRSGLIGAIINSEPAISRDDGVAYVQSGEGMLHAFDIRDAGAGTELWAFVPRSVLPTIGETVKRSYSFSTRLDGSPVVARSGANTKLLLAGSGAAGRSFHAIDVTSPRGLSEAALAGKFKWEFPAAGDASTLAKMGLAVGRPMIVKTAADGYVALFTSGYNNTADGKGRLWMVNVASGAIVHEFTVADGTLANESGLAQVSPFGELDGNVRYVYGGDLLGNVWRFDLAAKDAPFRLAVLKNAAGVAQPVTAAPELLAHDGRRIVIVGTGRLLDISDFGNMQVQSVYAISDGSALADPRAALVKQTYNRGANTITNVAVDWAVKRGWYLDLDAGEQVNTRPTIAFGALSFVSNINSGSNCAASSYLYVLNLLTGSSYSGTTFISSLISATANSSAVTALRTATPPGQAVKIVGSGQDADGKAWQREIITAAPIVPAKNAWREIRR